VTNQPAAVVLVALAAGCGADDAPAGDGADFRFLDRGLREHVPGAAAPPTAAWEVTAADGLGLVLAVRSTIDPASHHVLGTFPLAPGSAPWDPEAVPPDFYRFEAEVGGRTVSSPAIEAVQGVRFPDGPLALGAADVPHDIRFVVSNASVVAIDVVAVDAAQPPARHRLAHLTVASDLGPTGRFVGWTGADDTGAPLAAGTYQLAADVTAGDARYSDPGPTVTWAP
jgi:hypothetical protein